jgi:hypothetical protein
MPRRRITIPFSIVFLTIFVASLAAALIWRNEAYLPMSAERYAALCGNMPECYPEWGYLFGSVMMFGVALITGLLTVAFTGMSLLRR